MTNGHAPLVGTSHQQSNESVDLDNLFAFLSEVTPSPSNTIIDDIGEKMDSLVQDLDIELENVIQQEIEGLALDKPEKSSASSSKIISSKIGGVPSLPEPTGPPPPPPVVVNGSGGPPPPKGPVTNGSGNNMVPCGGGAAMNVGIGPGLSMPPLPPLPMQTKRRINRGDDEPIYEAVIPRGSDEFLPIVPELPEVPLHHAVLEHKLRLVFGG